MTTTDPIPAPALVPGPGDADAQENESLWPVGTKPLPDFLESAYTLDEADFEILNQWRKLLYASSTIAPAPARRP